jgi:O-antigen ligase
MSGLAAVVLSRSRGAWIILPWLAVLLVLQSRHRLRMAGLLTAVALVLGGAGVAYDARQPVQVERGLRLLDLWAELRQVGQPQASTSIGSRVLMWHMAVQTVQEHPWAGVGPIERVRRVQAVVPPEALSDVAPLVHVHQQFLNQAMDYGLPGLLAAALSLAAFGIAAVRCPPGRLRLQLVGLSVVHGVGLCFNANLTHGPYAFTLAALAAAVVLHALHESS